MHVLSLTDLIKGTIRPCPNDADILNPQLQFFFFPDTASGYLYPANLVAKYGKIRNVLFPVTASVHTHPANLAANTDIFEFAFQSGKT